jgi:Skp family chaperone for outer membrane proteins
MLQDIVNVFKAYESKFGKPFSVATAMKLEKESEKIKTVFKSTESKINPLYNELSSVANKLGISVGYPFLSEKNREIRFKINEPRMYRHPDEYGERAEKALSSKEYTNFEKLVNKIHDILEKTGKQIGYSVDVSASWN